MIVSMNISINGRILMEERKVRFSVDGSNYSMPESEAREILGDKTTGIFLEDPVLDPNGLS